MLGFTFVTPMVMQAISNDLTKNLAEAYSRLLNRPELHVDYISKRPNPILHRASDAKQEFITEAQD